MKSVKALLLLLLIVKAISSSADDTVEISTTLYAPDYTGKTVEITSTSTLFSAPTIAPVAPPPGPRPVTTLPTPENSPRPVPAPPVQDPAPPVQDPAPPIQDPAPVTTLPAPEFPPGPSPVTILSDGFESVVTLPPTRILNGKPNAQVVTITSTSYSVLSGGVATITSTNFDGEATTFPTYLPSGTVKVIQAIESPVDSTPISSSSVHSGSSDSLNMKVLQGIGMSIAVVFLNMFYALVA